MQVANRGNMSKQNNDHEKAPTYRFQRIYTDPTLSWKAKGLLIFALTKCPKTPLTCAQIKEISKEKRDGVYSILHELIAQKYCTVIPVPNEKGIFGIPLYSFTEFPDAERCPDYTYAYEPHQENTYTRDLTYTTEPTTSEIPDTVTTVTESPDTVVYHTDRIAEELRRKGRELRKRRMQEKVIK